MVVGLEEGDVAEPASEGLQVLDPGADVDQAREPARVEAGAAGSEDGRPMSGPPSRIDRPVETDLPDDRGCCVAIRRDLAFRVERVHLDLAVLRSGFPPGKRHSLRCRCHSVLVVQAISWPGSTTCPSSTTGSTCPYVKWPIRTMPSTVGRLRLHHAPHRSALERIDAVRPPRRRPALGPVVAHRDVDPGVVQLLTARVEPRAAYRVLPVPRGDRPAAIVVGVPGPQLAPSTGDGITSSGSRRRLGGSPTRAGS